MAISAIQQALADGALLLAEQLGIGGAAWDVSAPSGDGLTGPAGESPLGTWAGYVKRAAATDMRPSVPGVPVPATEWHAVGDDATVEGAPLETLLAVDHILTSQAEPALRFAIRAPYAVAGYVRFVLEAL